MGRLCEMALVSLLIMSLLNPESTWAKKISTSSVRKTPSSSSRGGTQSKPSSSKPHSPSQHKPYPSGGSYPHPGTGNTNQGGYPRQNPASYPGAGNKPNQNPGRVNPGGYPNQNPAPGYPAAGGYPNQNPGRAGTNQGGYPNQYPAAGGYPGAGGYPNQNPGTGGFSPGGYPVRGGNTGQGWGQPGANPGSYPGGAVGGYPNWNPNNKILSPRLGGGGGYGTGGSPFSNSVQSMGFQPKSSGFAKKAMMAAGVGALAGMAVGYGLGRFPRPHFSFRTPEEEYSYNNYMYRNYGSRSTDQKDFGHDYVNKLPPRAETYESFMNRCMSTSDTPKSGGNEEEDDTVSIEEIGYPALIDQVKSRRCVEEYIAYSKSFLEERKAEQHIQPTDCSSILSYGVIQLFTSLFMLLSSMFLLQ
uniref:prion protein b n=1 Tax=Monopterus albus TaxID=43700 RepID=UPI0009B3DD49|nr:uncharacterized protein LOC109963436 [Monopterus albus]